MNALLNAHVGGRRVAIIVQVKTRPLFLWSGPPLVTESAMVPAMMLTNPAAK